MSKKRKNKKEELIFSCLKCTIVVKITDNGKSIGEVRAFEEQKVQETPNVANAFSMKLNYKKMWNRKA